MSTVTTAERLIVVRSMSMDDLQSTLQHLQSLQMPILHELQLILETEIDKRLVSGKLDGSGEPCPENVCANCEIAATCDKRKKKDITL